MTTPRKRQQPKAQPSDPEMVPVSVPSPTTFGKGTVRVVVQRRAFGKTGEHEEIAWPTDWRLPDAGDAIHLSERFGGFVEYVDWDLGTGVVRVNIR